MLSRFVKRASEGIHLKAIAERESEREKEGEERQGEANSNL